MNNKGITVWILILLLGTSFIGAPLVLASPSTILYAGLKPWSYGGAASAQYMNLDTKYVQLSNGRLVCAFIDYTDSTYIHIKVVNSDGSSYGTVDYRQNVIYYMRDCSLLYVSDTVVYIAYTYQYLNTVTMLKFGMIKFNPSTLAVPTPVVCSDISTSASTMTMVYAFITPIVAYNSKYYYMSSNTFWDGAIYKAYVYLMEYTPDTTISATQFEYVAGGASYVYPVYWFNYGSGVAYAMYATSTTALSYYTVSLSAKTKTLLVAHNEPTDTVTYETSQYSHYLGGNLVSNGTDKYLYFSWVRPHVTGGVSTITWVQEVMKYNTTVDTAHFTSYQRNVLGITLNYSGYSTRTWALGLEFSKTQYRLYYPDDKSGITYMNRIIITITDWFDTSVLSYTHVVGTTESLPDIINQLYPVSQQFSTQWGFCYDSTGIMVLYRLASLYSTYTITAIITPNDSPYIQNKQYYTTITGKVNGIGRGGLAVEIIINSGGIPETYGLSSTGTLIRPTKFTSTGAFSITFNLKDVRVDLSIVATTTKSGVVQAEDETTPSGGAFGPWMGGVTTMFSSYVPPLITIIVPAVIMAKIVGPIGFIAGAFIGVILAVSASIIPQYVLYLIFLVLGIVALVVIRGRGGGGDGT